MVGLDPENARIFRITHIDNVPWILANGLCCANHKRTDPNFQPIGRADIISKRTSRVVTQHPGGTLSDYVPFYFTPRSMMLYNIKTGWNGLKMVPMTNIAICFSSLHKVREEGLDFLFTDRHALMQGADFYRDLDDLDKIDWGILQRSDFKRDVNDPDKCERYQAEALIHHHVPVSALSGIACYNQSQKEKLLTEAERLKLTIKITVQSDWYF